MRSDTIRSIVRAYDDVIVRAYCWARFAILRQPSRFLYDFHFYHHADAPMIQRLRAELVRDLGARAPALIVLWEPGWPAGGYERIDGFPALRTLLTTRYALAREGDAYRVYAKRHDP